MKKIIIDGRLTANPELKETKAGKIATFSIANNDTKDSTEYYNIVAWNSNAERAIEHLSKGMKVVIAGSFKKERYTNPEGKVKETFVISVETFSFLSNKIVAEGGET